MNTKTLRETVLTVAGALLFAALHAAAIDSEDRIMNGQIVDTSSADLIASVKPNPCYCTESCQ